MCSPLDNCTLLVHAFHRVGCTCIEAVQKYLLFTVYFTDFSQSSITYRSKHHQLHSPSSKATKLRVSRKGRCLCELAFIPSSVSSRGYKIGLICAHLPIRMLSDMISCIDLARRRQTENEGIKWVSSVCPSTRPHTVGHRSC